MLRAKSCVVCDAVLLYTAKTCTSCGATQPDPEELRRLRGAKEHAFEKARRGGGDPVGEDGSERPPLSPTRRAILIAVPCFLGALLLQYLVTQVSEGHIYLVLAAWLLYLAALIATLWAIIHSAVVCAIRWTRED